MMLKPVPMIGIGIGGKSSNVSGQMRTNLYAEIVVDQEKRSRITLFPTPGTVLFDNFGETPVRCAYPLGNYIYVVHLANVWKVANDGTATKLGTLNTSTGRVAMIDNGTQIVLVDGTNGYVLTIATGVIAQIVAAGFPNGATTVGYHNSYFIVEKPNSGRFYVSGQYDGTAWSALDYAAAESSPDNLVRVISDQGQIVLFGERTTEFWGDSGAADFPFARIGGGTVEWGLAARWSVAKFGNALALLRKNRLGQVQIALLEGYDAQAISTPDLDYRINSYSTVSDAAGFSYMLNGHQFYQINFPSAGESWLYDGLSQCWSKVSTNGGRHVAEMQFNYLDKPYVTDYATGKMYRFDYSTYTDNGDPIIREVVGRHLDTADWSVLDEFWIEMEGGVGVSVGHGSAPQIMLQVSKDNGHTWGNERWVPIGAMGKYQTRAVWRRLGRSRDWMMKVRISDPVKPVFVGCWGRFGG